MVDLSNIKTHDKITYTFMPPSVAHLIGFVLNQNNISGWTLCSAHSAKRKGLIPSDIVIPKVPLHENEPNGKIVLRNREWVLISHLDSEGLKSKFEDILNDDDISKLYLDACGQDNLDQY